jgi:hypothetical protein
MSCKRISDSAPLGSAVRYSDGQPKPPERFRRKVQAWERTNGSGLLVEKRPQGQFAGRVSPATITLRTGVFGSGGVIVMIVHKTFDAGSNLEFTFEPPPAGSVQVLTGRGDREELRHIAPDVEQARSWLSSHGYPDARLMQLGAAAEAVELPVAA